MRQIFLGTLGDFIALGILILGLAFGIYFAIEAIIAARKARWYYTHYSRQLTLEKASEIYRAMNNDKEAQKVVTFEDVAGLTNAPTFEKFLKWNKNIIQIGGRK